MNFFFKKIFSAKIQSINLSEIYKKFPELFTKSNLRKIFLESPAVGEGLTGSVHLMAVTASGVASALTGNIIQGLSVTAIGGGALICDYLKATQEQQIPKQYEEKTLKLVGSILYNMHTKAVQDLQNGFSLLSRTTNPTELDRDYPLLKIVEKSKEIIEETKKVFLNNNPISSIKLGGVDLDVKIYDTSKLSKKTHELETLIKGLNNDIQLEDNYWKILIKGIRGLTSISLSLKGFNSIKKIIDNLNEDSKLNLGVENFINKGSLHPLIDSSNYINSNPMYTSDAIRTFERENSLLKKELKDFYLAYSNDRFETLKISNKIYTSLGIGQDNPFFADEDRDIGVSEYVDNFLKRMDQLNEYERTPNPILRQVKKAGNYKDFPYEFTGAMFTGFSIGSMIVASIFEKDPEARQVLVILVWQGFHFGYYQWKQNGVAKH
ncbi:MAG: hypothetical protein SFT90_08100 [Rickettsiales bacterium]|nr:hypothetical protein [Rickettsiales bacterium]